MPSPATPTRPSKSGGGTQSASKPSKSLDIGQPLGVHDTNSVRSIVRKWQQQGGGVITIDDGVYNDDGNENENENDEDEENKIRTPSKATKPKSEAGKPPKAKSSKGPVAQTRKRSHSTPRKRVISDEHWRRNRSTTTVGSQPSVRNLPAPKRISEYTINDSGVTVRTKKETQKELPDRTRDTPRSGTKTPAKEFKAKPRKRPDSVVDSDWETETDRPKSTIRSEVSTKQKRESPPPEDAAEWGKSEADFTELSRRRARGRCSRCPSPSPPRPPPPTANRGAKIEAWLSETPDPFLDYENKDDMPVPLDIKSARERRSRRLGDTETSSSLTSETQAEGEPRPKSSHSRQSKDSKELREKEKEKYRPSSSGKSTKIHEDPAPEPKRASLDKSHKHPPKAKEEKPVLETREVKEPSIVPSESDVQVSSEKSEASGNNAPVPTGRKKSIPSTGPHRLSTIASGETLSILPEESSGPSSAREKPKDSASEEPKPAEDPEEAGEEKDQFDPDSLPVVSSQLKRRLTTHNDLMSVLSVPASRTRSVRSSRSIRTNKSRLASATIPDLFVELASDETKYMRELKTLVGGVIPVLLTCVLSRSDSAIAAGLFRPSVDPKDDINFSKPIVNMGVAIERLKTLHKRIPQNDIDALLNWAQGAQKVYREYLKAWRLGFKDVIVNLAPLEEGEENENADTKSLDEGMERDENGDVVDADGEKVDVAYLLKRPLVRLKYLAKSFKGINTLQPSPKAEEISTAYQSLVLDARKRARDERARLEDESAATVDATRARDPMTLAVARNVVVDQTRRVRARDFFNLSLYHSSGQLVDCRAELLYRDNSSGSGSGGDLLICEIDHSDRWLLFPPMDLRCVSARNGETGEIVLMLRSAAGDEKYWQELISLRIDDYEIGVEWVQLLGSDPIPPSIFRSQSFISRAKQHKARKSSVSDSPPRANPSDIDIPIGEKRRSLTPKEHYSEPSTVSSSATETRSSLSSSVTRETDYTTGGSELSAIKVRTGFTSLPSQTSPDKSPNGLKRSKAKRHSRYGDSPISELAPAQPIVEETVQEKPQDQVQDSTPTKNRFYGGESNDGSQVTSPPPKSKSASRIPQPKTPRKQQSPEPESPRVSSVPSARLPQIPKIRTASSQTHLSTPASTEADEEEDYPPLDSLPDPGPLETPTKSRRRKSRHKSKHDDAPPPPPPHRSPSAASGNPSNSPVLTPSGARFKRRGSSPLKHEYEPSTASDSYTESDSDASTVRHYSYSSSEYSRSASEDSDSYSEDSASEDEESELSELPKPRRIHTATSDASSLSPSNSASQSGYRAVPLQPAKSSKAVASIFAWSDKGSWDPVLPDECDISVSPGLIEAFKTNADHRSKPLISMELTPLVPIRRGTAIDISIRSPPTERSKIASSNIMFRSRSPDECDALYGLINQARINNPTYIALQNARGPFNENLPSFEPAAKSGSNWFGFPRRRRSYRASNSNPRSLAEGSESSVGTMSSAFSALKRFGGGSKMFNISRSTVESRNGREESIYSGSGDSADGPSPSSGIGRIAAAIKGADGIGLSNAKIRIYLRESASKWRDMGGARLTIMPSPPKNPSRPGTAVSGRSSSGTMYGGDAAGDSPPSSGAATPHRDVEPEKRIIIRGKTRGEVLLDVCLPESSFERVARTGIAISVLEETNGGPAKQGGVNTSFQRIYMIQMKSEAEAAYTFGLVGKLRY
ncbi:uncharacterized protein N7483_006504 [Penicillium malachiteum]|uniref:uncharacterized protein n=1 Tax=Penicillium malachiteum TaxID=1324776 RepID=UPI002548C203|nr:uncharacterized protein N7483_006504 [Penicillium malachiteum]KAJ5725147.1 hypothetical protein N7483_006504 [Penicillium malachiteum]